MGGIPADKILPGEGKYCRSINWTLSDFPSHRGHHSTGPGKLAEGLESDTNLGFNYAKMTLLNFWTPCFIARRGGLRWKYNYMQIGHGWNLNNHGTLSVTRGTPASDAKVDVKYIPYFPTSNTENNLTQAGNNVFSATLSMEYPSGISGQAITPTVHQPVIEAELPYYSNKRFANARQADFIDTNPEDGTPFHYVTLLAPAISEYIQNNTYVPFIMSHVAAADDFSLHFYLGPPILYCLKNKKTEPNKAYNWFGTPDVVPTPPSD